MPKKINKQKVLKQIITTLKKRILRWDDPEYEQMRLDRYKKEKLGNTLDQNVIQNQLFFTQTLKPKDAVY